MLDLEGFCEGRDERPGVVAEVVLERRVLVRSLAFSPAGDVLALGTHKGPILVHAIGRATEAAGLAVTSERAHRAMVNHLVFRPTRGLAGGLELESVSKDGTRVLHWVGRSEGGEWAMRSLRSEGLTRGELSQILPPRVEGGEARYLGLVDLTALVVDPGGNTVSCALFLLALQPTFG